MPPFRNYIIYISQVLLPMVFIINRTTLTDAIVLPVSVTSGSTRPISHNFNQLNGLIKDIFNTNNSSTSNSNTVENTSSSPVTTNALFCWDRCVPIQTACVTYTDTGEDNDDDDEDVDTDTENDVDANVENGGVDGDAADDGTGDGFLDIRIAMDDVTSAAATTAAQPEYQRSRRRFCSPSTHKCCGRSIAPSPQEIAVLAAATAAATSTATTATTATAHSHSAQQMIMTMMDEQNDEGMARQKAPATTACGISWTTHSRVTGDGASGIDEFPWMAAIRWQRPAGRISYKCSGSLIHPSVVLTVAHCVYDAPAERLFVRVGGQNVHQTFADDSSTGLDHRLRQIIVHERFNASRYSMHNDIALLFLDRPVRLSSLPGGSRTVCLPAPVVGRRIQGISSSFDNQRCVVSGWTASNSRRHQSRFRHHRHHHHPHHSHHPQTPPTPANHKSLHNEQKHQRTLNKIQVPIVPRKLCERSLRSTRLGRRFRLHPSFMCAGGEPGRDACTGDGGSPLVCVANSKTTTPIKMPDGNIVDGGQVRYVQTGIVALGIGCGNNVPAVYVNVAEFRQWIDDQMLTNGYARRFYQL